MWSSRPLNIRSVVVVYVPERPPYRENCSWFQSCFNNMIREWMNEWIIYFSFKCHKIKIIAHNASQLGLWIMPKPSLLFGTSFLFWFRAQASRYYFILFWRYYSVQTSSNLNLSKLQSFNYLPIAEVQLNWQLLSSESLSVFTCSGFSLRADRCCTKTTLAWKLRHPPPIITGKFGKSLPFLKFVNSAERLSVASCCAV